ncbi:MAG: hypothetical protein Hals2KO_02150 [Halioglobus sp.]
MSEEIEPLPLNATPLPWHQAELAAFAEQYQRGKLAHALLLYGAPDTGKRRLAQALARLLLCANPQDGLPCGNCHPCELAASGHNSDVCWQEPKGGSRVIKIEQVRAAVAFTQGTASFSPNKVAVFAPAQKLNLNAHNALLKSLEEPAPDTYLLLVCDSLNAIPATIRSRCRMQPLPDPDEALCLQWLQETTQDSALAESLLSLAEGRPLLAQALYSEDRVESYSACRLALRSLLAQELVATDIWNGFSDEDPDAFLQMLASELRLRIKGLSAQALASAEGRALFKLLDETLHIRRAVAAGSNPAPQMLVDQMLSKSHRELGEARRGDTI